MGLDMYLYAERFVSEFTRKGDKDVAEKIRELIPEFGEGTIQTVRAEVGYWRKANAIHNWFVKNIQNNNDDCGDYYVSRKELKELLDVIQKVLADNSLSPELLPTTTGFFFGNTSYDEYYFIELHHTVGILNKALELDPSLELFYSSSW